MSNRPFNERLKRGEFRTSGSEDSCTVSTGQAVSIKSACNAFFARRKLARDESFYPMPRAERERQGGTK